MAIDVGTLQAVLKLRDEMSPALKSVEKNVSVFSAGLSKLAGMAAGVLSVGAAISAVNKAMMAQAEAEAAINKLNLALANQGMYTEATSKALQDHAAALQEVTTFDDEAIKRGEALLASFRMNEDQIKRTTTAAADLAAGMGMDLESAVTMLGKAFAGNTTMLARYGIVVDENIPKAQRFEAVLAQLEQRFGGQAQAATQNYAGSLKQLQNALNDTWESAGKLFGFLSSTGDKPFQGLINGAKVLQTLFGVQIPLAFTELKANIATSLAGMAGMLEKLFDFVGKIPGSIGQQYRRGAEEMGLLRSQLEGMADKFREQGNAAAASVGNIQAVTNATGALALGTKELTEEEKKLAEQGIKRVREEQQLLEKAMEGSALKMYEVTNALNDYLNVTVQVVPSIGNLTDVWNEMNAALGQGPEMDPDIIRSEIAWLESELKKAAPSWGNALKEGISTGLAGLPQVIVGAIQGGGDVFKAVGAHLGGVIGSSLGEQLAKSIGGTLGKALGSLAGPLGSLLGAGLGSLFDKLGIGGNKVIMQVNDMRDAFFEAEGGWLAFSQKMATVSDEDWAKKIFNAKTVEEFNRLVKEAKGLLGDQEAAQQAVEDAAKRYGLTIEELGPKFQQQQLDEMVGQLLQDYELLKASGADMNAVIEKMAPSFNEYVQTALAAGQSLPENMKPIIDQMIAQGLLLDANGKAYASAEEAGITYTQSLTEGLAQVIEQIKALVAALTGVQVPPIHVPVVYDDPGAPGGKGGSSEYGPEGYASGTPGFEDFGAGRLAVLHGVERVQTPEQAAAELQRAAGGPGSKELLAEMQGLRRDLIDLPQMMKRSFRDAMAFR